MARQALVRSFLWELAALRMLSPHRRVRLLRRLGLVIGERTVVEPCVHASSPRVAIGARCYIGYNAYFDAHGGITIGDDVSIGAHVRILTREHPIAPGPIRHLRRPDQDIDRPVRIGDGCWLGAGVTILPGVTIGAASVIAAGSVVTRDVRPDALYAGIPARPKRDLPPGLPVAVPPPLPA